MELTPTSHFEDFFWQYGPTIIETYYWLLMITGTGLAAWAFMRSKNRGYALVTLFFVLSMWSTASFRYIEENYESEDYGGEIPEEAIHQNLSIISIPIAETILVIGIYLVSRKQMNANKSVVTTPEAARPTS